MSRTTAIVVCDHGLGHVRRCALKAKFMEKSGEKVTLFAPLSSIGRLLNAVPSIAGLNIIDFSTRTSSARIKKGMRETIEWVDRLPNLDGFNNVICDNLPEILKIRPDAAILAQFFWHDVIEGAATDYVKYCNELLAIHKPTVLGCDLFAMDLVRWQPGYKPLSLFKIPELVEAALARPIEQCNDLLVTGGTTKVLQKQLQKIIKYLLKNGPGGYSCVHVDYELMPKNPPAWMISANFSVNMYCRLKAAICRPGLGVITDLMTVGAIITPIFEAENKEMEHNAIKILKINQAKARLGLNDWIAHIK